MTDGLMILEKLLDHYSTEAACIEALMATKWSNGFTCRYCGHNRAYKITTRKIPLFECAACRHQSSLLAGTVMEGSKTSLQKWFHALLLVSFQPTGVNAVQLRAAISVTYKTAWLMLHKIRYAMNQDAGKLLSGIVRINSAIYGNPHNASVLRHPKEQPLLIGASITDKGEPACIKIKLVANEHLRERLVVPDGTKVFIKYQVAPGTVDVQCVTARFSPLRFKKLVDIVHEASCWISNKFNGIGPKHLQAYLDEFSYRINMKLENAGISMFTHLTRQCVSIPTLTYSALIG
ncbi:transposase [Paenibacillus agricola]|uniref:IS1595 family transposase n=1 Tax=Paenibacillus agricola TaxID=2716264 RepID=A0ABX0J6R0_9BACL|nr:transposase [Paenibacillus agricola]NHN32039.1 IS1595 family transposase [Paenibacillus agricola]